MRGIQWLVTYREKKDCMGLKKTKGCPAGKLQVKQFYDCRNVKGKRVNSPSL